MSTAPATRDRARRLLLGLLMLPVVLVLTVIALMQLLGERGR